MILFLNNVSSLLKTFVIRCYCDFYHKMFYCAFVSAPILLCQLTQLDKNACCHGFTISHSQMAFVPNEARRNYRVSGCKKE